jgi:hypothetical protein
MDHLDEISVEQLQDALSNRFFDSLDELTTAIDTALDQPSLPKVSNYF